uniref:Uncharacterized protein n=1 Tax=Aceria tosichella TaxID=561515 RepID=A0A6G1SP91_9ACAR
MLAYGIISRCNQFSCIIRTQNRNIRGVRKVIRQTLPRYRNSLMNLRNWDEMTGVVGQEDTSLNKLWSDRLEFYKLYMPPKQTHTLLEALFNPNNNIDQLLRIIDENLPTMNSFYLATSFEALNDMMQLRACDIDTVIVSPELKNLCKRTLVKLRFFEADEVLKLIKCLSTMRMPEETFIAQSAMQMARHLLNDFNASELLAMKESLENLQASDISQKSLLAAMKQATLIRLARVERHHEDEQISELEVNKQIGSKK